MKKTCPAIFLFFLFRWIVAAVSWSIKHVCIHTQGASLHADFAHSRNKFRGPSVREVGVIFLPPQFHTEAINWSLSQEEQSRLSRQYTYSCSIQENHYCHSGAFCLDIILSVLRTEAPDVVVWFPVRFSSPLDALCNTYEERTMMQYSYKKKKDSVRVNKTPNVSRVSAHAALVSLFDWPTMLISNKKSSSNTSSPRLVTNIVTAQRCVSCRPGLIWPMTALRQWLSPPEQKSCSCCGFHWAEAG